MGTKEFIGTQHERMGMKKTPSYEGSSGVTQGETHGETHRHNCGKTGGPNLERLQNKERVSGERQEGQRAREAVVCTLRPTDRTDITA